MADAVALAASLITLVTSAYNSCQRVYEVSSSIINAPSHISTISTDLGDFYLVLASLQTLLNEDSFTQRASYLNTSKDLNEALKSSMRVFADLSSILGMYKKPGSRFPVAYRFRWTFKEKEVEDLRKSLNAKKLTLNTAISVATLYDTNSANVTVSQMESDMTDHVHDFHKRLESLQLELEDVRAAQLPQGRALLEMNEAALGVDYDFNIRQFLNETPTDGTITPSPSMQVSSLRGTNSILTSTAFHTAPTHITGGILPALAEEPCQGITVLGVPGIDGLRLKVEPHYSIDVVMSLIQQRFAKTTLEDHSRLRYGGQFLDPLGTLSSCGVHDEASLLYYDDSEVNAVERPYVFCVY